MDTMWHHWAAVADKIKEEFSPSQTRWAERKPSAIVRNLPGRSDGGYTPWALNALSTLAPDCWR